LAGTQAVDDEMGIQFPSTNWVAPTHWKPVRTPVHALLSEQGSEHIVPPLTLTQLRARQSLLLVQQYPVGRAP